MRIGTDAEAVGDAQPLAVPASLAFRVAVDRGVEHRPALLAREVGHVAPAAGEVDTNGNPDLNQPARHQAPGATTSDRPPSTVIVAPVI